MRRNILSLSAFLLLATIIWLDRNFHLYLKTSVSTQKQETDDWCKYNERSFTVVEVVDGDTIDINVPDANDATTRIRLLGIDTPETKNPHTNVMYFGPEASRFTSDTILKQNVFVIMDANSKPRDKYKRLLCYIKLTNGKILNEELISEGFAYADPRFSHSHLKKYTQLEKVAQKQKKGLWEKVSQEQMPRWYKKKIRN